MAYETITVRMNRSSSSIPWGISIRGGPVGAFSIASVEKESLADKAGIEVNDTITELAGRNTTSMSIQEARNIIERPSDEIYMLLQRHITSHPTLPWTLTAEDNRIIVDQVRPQDTSMYKSLQNTETRNQFSAHSTSSYEVPPPTRYDAGSYRSSTYSKFSDHDKRDERTVPISRQMEPFTNVTNSKSYDNKLHMREGFRNSYTTDSYTKTEPHQGGAGGAYQSQQQPHQASSQVSPGTRNVPIALSHTSSASVPAPVYTPQPPSEQNAFKANMSPVHVHTNYGTSFGQKSPVSPYRRSAQPRIKSEASYHDEGPHVAFQHSPRTRRQLSPSASIRHLQYNSPMNLYSPESAAEEYLRQTGGLFGTESSTHVEPIHHVSAPRHSPAIVKPIADRATPNSGGPIFEKGGSAAAEDAVATFKPRNAPADKPIPLGPASAPVQQSETKAPVSGSIPAPPPPPPGTAFSAKVNPIKPPGASSNASARVASERSPVSPSVRRTPAENQAHAVAQQSPKVRRELSPQATIRHLQYNSPMNIYSMESAAEQYLRQTGGLFGTETDPNRLKSQDPGYLHSQTLRLIEEEERGLDHRATSPAQSSSFKRISAACGTPVE